MDERVMEGLDPVEDRYDVVVVGARAARAATAMRPRSTGAGLEVDGYHWYWAPGAAAGAIPTNGGKTLLFSGVSRRRFDDEVRGDVPGAYRRLLDEGAPEVAARLGKARLEGSLHGFPGHPGHLRRPRGLTWRVLAVEPRCGSSPSSPSRRSSGGS